MIASRKYLCIYHSQILKTYLKICSQNECHHLSHLLIITDQRRQHEDLLQDEHNHLLRVKGDALLLPNTQWSLVTHITQTLEYGPLT